MSGEESADQQRVGDEMKTQATEDPQGDHQRDGQMDGEEPLEGILADSTPPIAERQIDEEDQACDE